jgi:hypothetical protein
MVCVLDKSIIFRVLVEQEESQKKIVYSYGRKQFQPTFAYIIIVNTNHLIL